MADAGYHDRLIETMDRSSLDALIDERVRYTVRYANEHSHFYRHWFRENGINPGDIRVHEDLLDLPIISGKTIREHQPPVTPGFEFMSAGWGDIFTVQETSGTSGTPKSFFLTWEDWKRYAQKYARSFVSQGFSAGDRVIVCASYGMNVGANTMTLAARKIGMTVIPFGKCSFPPRVITSYRPTAIVGSVFKLLRLGRRLSSEGIRLQETSIRCLVAGESYGDVVMRVGVECFDPERADRKGVEERFISRHLKYKRDLARSLADGTFSILFTFTGTGGLELHKVKGRPKRLVDRRNG